MKDKLIAKLKELVIHVGFDPDTSESDIIEALKSSNCPECLRFASELTALEQEPTEYAEKGTDEYLRQTNQFKSELGYQSQESKEQKIKDKCSKIYDKVKEAWTPDKRTFEQVEEQESKEEPKDMYGYPLTTANNHVQLSESRGTELPPVDLEQVLGSKQEGAEEILAKCTCIDLKELEFKNEVQIIRPSESLEAMQEYAQQSRREELIKYEIAQNTVGGKLHGSKERIIECVDKYLNPKP